MHLWLLLYTNSVCQKNGPGCILNVKIRIWFAFCKYCCSLLVSNEVAFLSPNYEMYYVSIQTLAILMIKQSSTEPKCWAAGYQKIPWIFAICGAILPFTEGFFLSLGTSTMSLLNEARREEYKNGSA